MNVSNCNNRVSTSCLHPRLVYTHTLSMKVDVNPNGSVNAALNIFCLQAICCLVVTVVFVVCVISWLLVLVLALAVVVVSWAQLWPLLLWSPSLLL